MRESLRTRLLLWHAVIVAIVVTSFGAGVSYLAWRSRLSDIDAALHARAAALAGALRPADGGSFDLTLPRRLPADDADRPYHVLWDTAGQVIDRSDPELTIDRPAHAGAVTRGARRELALITTSGATIVVGRDLSRARSEVWALAGAILVAGVFAVALSLVGGWWLVSRAMNPIARISSTARAMVEGDFAARVPIDRVETEFGQLGRALNQAFDRLHASLIRQRRFTADASHELRTPLATISTEMQWALSRERAGHELRPSLEATARAAGRMEGVVERLLALARQESETPPDLNVSVQLDAVVREAAQDLLPLAAERRVDISLDAVPVAVSGDPERLREAVSHLVTNAIRYNRDAGHVQIRVQHAGDHADVSISDTGAGIAESDLPRVFEPFFRTDAARSRDGGGAGLGLAVTRAIVTRHGGEVLCTSELGCGTTMTVRLPVALTSSR